MTRSNTSTNKIENTSYISGFQFSGTEPHDSDSLFRRYGSQSFRSIQADADDDLGALPLAVAAAPLAGKVVGAIKTGVAGVAAVVKNPAVVFAAGALAGEVIKDGYNAIKNALGFDVDSDELDVVAQDGNSEVIPAGGFSYWADAEAASEIETEVVGHPGGPHPVTPDAVEPDFGSTGESMLKESGMDGLVAPDPVRGFSSTVRELFGQSDSVSGDVLANADTGASGWLHMHHDDGIQDSYLDVGADTSGFVPFLLQNGADLMAPVIEHFAEVAGITDFVTGKSSSIATVADPLASAGPLDTVTVNEPRNNDF